MGDEKDDDLWAMVTRNIKRIPRTKPLLSGDQAEGKKPAPPNKLGPQAQTRPVIVKPRDEGARTQDAGRGLDRRSADKLRKGQMPIEARLDLHGMTQEQAYSALQSFILSAQASGKRCVLVITGKGAGKDGRRDPLAQGQGVLKRMVPEWLGQPPLRAAILKTETARPQHGGEGALYVLLRRKR